VKIAQVNPGYQSIPPDKWGAMEEIIWQYKINFEKLGHRVDIVYADQINSGDYDLVHLHVGRLSVESDHLDGGLIHRQVPYIFTMHDVSSHLFGRDSKVYVHNEYAIKGSLFSTVGCKAFRDIFPSECRDKLEWLLHGVDTEFFSPPDVKESRFSGKHKLLCVGMKEPRKQFHLALEAAKILDLPITIVGPEHDYCKEYALKYFHNSGYDKLTLIEDSNKNELKKIHNEHTILVHPSYSETGNPCLAVMEAMSSGLPVVGTNMDEYSNEHDDDFPDLSNIPGFLNCVSSAEDIAKKIEIIIDSYSEYTKQAREFALEHTWEKVCKRILNVFEFHKTRKKTINRNSDLFDQILAHAKHLDEKEYEEKVKKLGYPHHLLPAGVGKSWLVFHLEVLRKELGI
jgi:glycosyltransferase involved in cell wall biosynthesis